MKTRSVVFLLMLAGLSMMVAACGGGGGGGAPAPTPISVMAAQNPVLNGYSTAITASFGKYSSAVKGSTANFSISGGAATLSSTAAPISSGGLASVHVRSGASATYTVSASSGSFAGSTTVSFIPQPATAATTVGLNRTIAGVGAIGFDLVKSSSAVFTNFSSLVPSTPGVTAFSDTPTTGKFGWISLNALAVTPNLALFKISSVINPAVDGKVPLFSVSTTPGTIFANYTSANPVAPPVLPTDFTISTRYYDATGKLLFP